MPTTLTIGGVVREILTADLSLSADAVVARAKAKGLKASDKSIRATVYNIKSELKRKSGGATATPAKAVVAPAEPAPKPEPVATAARTTAPATSSPLTDALALVELVARTADAAGGVETARRVSDAVRACGGADDFDRYLELVATIRGATG